MVSELWVGMGRYGLVSQKMEQKGTFFVRTRDETNGFVRLTDDDNGIMVLCV